MGGDETSIGLFDKVTYYIEKDDKEKTATMQEIENDDGVFYNCTALTSVTVNAIDPPTLSNMAFDNTNNCPIYVPASAVDEYKESTATGWSDYASRIQAIQ